jgi:hypothetical protein
MTNFYLDKQFVRSEEDLTFKEYVALGEEMAPGTLIVLRNDIETNEAFPTYECFFMGNATREVAPNYESRQGVDWDLSHPRFSKYVSEVHLPSFKPIAPWDNTVQKTKSMCVGCYNNFYNGNGAEGCWDFPSAVVKTRYQIEVCTRPTEAGAFTKMETLSCYRKSGVVFYNELPDFVRPENVID